MRKSIVQEMSGDTHIPMPLKEKLRQERHKLLGCACLVLAASKHNVGANEPRFLPMRP